MTSRPVGERWATCPKCGLLFIYRDAHIVLSRVHCEWCDLAPRWLTADERTAVLANADAVEAVRAGRYVNMSAAEGQYTFTIWGSRAKSRSKAHYPPRRR